MPRDRHFSCQIKNVLVLDSTYEKCYDENSLYEEKDEKITIKDVAKAAGVSISAVSRVFNGYEDISEETQKKFLLRLRN